MSKISIGSVLLDLRAGEKCSLVFIRGTGSKRGTKKTIYNAIEGYNYAAFKAKTPVQHMMAKHKKGIGKHALNGTIPIIDLDSDQQLTLLISHIIGFNGLKVMH